MGHIEDARHRVLAAGAKPGAAHQSYLHPLNHDDRGQGGHDIGPHGPASPMAVASPSPRPGAAPPRQTGNSRGADGAASRPSRTGSIGRWARHLVGGLVKHGVEGERLAPLRAPPDASPSADDHKGQDSAG